MRKSLWLSLVFWIALTSIGFGQQLDRVQGSYLIKLRAEKDVHSFQAKTRSQSPHLQHFTLASTSIAQLGIYTAQIDHIEVHEYRFLDWLRKQPEVELAQFNHILEWRATLPNDPLFTEQWQYLNLGNNGGVAGYDLDADLAWDICTGGLTPRGDTIVVAVIDNGIYPTHPDLSDNLWINFQEIPDNNIDDDGNGYLDDYNGWNITTQSDLIDPLGISGHGTSVAGMIGAKGNNQIGVAGINWNVKLLVISNPEIFTEARALQAYSYVHKMRQLYNQTGGEKGAFIVASNSSWGKDFGFPEDAPIWCGMYDKMGEVGVLSCGATANLDTNIDIEGDLPSTCPSDYLIAVTNVDNTGSKVVNAGYGSTNIDLASFGEMAFTTTRSMTLYKPFQGTSAAAPQVAGAIALLYSSPCNELTDLSRIDPAAAALQARDYILNGVHPNNNLNNIVATGGQLNLFNSVQLALDACGNCPLPQQIKATPISSNEIQINWQLPYYGQTSTLRYRIENTQNWITVTDIVSPYTLTGIATCNIYEFELKTNCNNEESDFSPTQKFHGGECCIAPTEITSDVIDEETVSINWVAIDIASEYKLQYRPIGGNIWTELIAFNAEIIISDLNPCQEYEFSIESQCNGIPSMGFSEFFFFRTKGCGACLDINYCQPNGNANFEWIKRVKLNDLEKGSENDNGYQNFTEESTTLLTYNSYEIELEPGYIGVPIKEFFQVWIDYNQDGDFQDIEEKAYQSSIATKGLQKGIINIPPSAISGSTRMRVAMSYSGSTIPSACDIGFNGEMEDYCINIVQGTPECDIPTDLDTLETSQIHIAITWEDFTDDHIDHNIRYRLLSNTTSWVEEKKVTSPHFITNLIPCETYVIQVEANCVSGGIGGYGPELAIRTICSTNTLLPQDFSQLSIWPNPFYSSIQVAFLLIDSGPINVQLFEMDGKLVYERNTQNLQNGFNILEVDHLDQLSSGIYIIKISSQKHIAYRKIVKF